MKLLIKASLKRLAGKFNTSTNVKNLSDDDLCEYHSWLSDETNEPNPDNEDARQEAIKRAKREMDLRDITEASQE